MLAALARRLRPARVLTAAVVLAACGSDAEGIAVTEAEPGALRAPQPGALGPGGADTLGRPAPLDTVYADSGLYEDPSLDSLRADSVRREAAPTPPDFRAFWPRFRDAVEDDAVASLAGRGGVEALGRVGPVVFAEPFRERVRALTARDFRREGTAREATVRVGYDRAGRVVPEDEAAREASATLRFDVVDGAYRLVDLRTAGR